jgi:hypothetical protein
MSHEDPLEVRTQPKRSGPGQRLGRQVSNDEASFQGVFLLEPVGEHNAMAPVFMRIVISA